MSSFNRSTGEYHIHRVVMIAIHHNLIALEVMEQLESQGGYTHSQRNGMQALRKAILSQTRALILPEDYNQSDIPF